MNNKFLFLSIIILLTSTSLFAQRRFDPDKQIKNLTKELNLNEEQQNSILEILNNTQDGIEKLMKEAGEDRSTVRAEMRELLQASNKKIEDELNAKQKIRYRELLEERRKNRGNRGNGQN